MTQYITLDQVVSVDTDSDWELRESEEYGNWYSRNIRIETKDGSVTINLIKEAKIG